MLSAAGMTRAASEGGRKSGTLPTFPGLQGEGAGSTGTLSCPGPPQERAQLQNSRPLTCPWCCPWTTTAAWTQEHLIAEVRALWLQEIYLDSAVEAELRLYQTKVLGLGAG